MSKKLQPKYKFVKWAVLIILFFLYSIVSVNKSWNDDFRAYYQAGSLITSNVNIYDKSVVEGGFLYSPAFALIMAPLSIFPQILAASVWYIGNIASLIFLILLSIYMNSGTGQHFIAWVRTSFVFTEKTDKNLKWAVIILLIITARFWLNSIEHGQINIQLWCIVLFSIYYWRKKSYLLSGFLLSVAIIIKILPLLLLFYFLLKRQYYIIFITVCCLVIFLIIPALFIGWQQNISLLTYWINNILVSSYDHFSSAVGDSNQSLPAMILRFLSDVPGNEQTGNSVNILSSSIPVAQFIIKTIQVVFILILIPIIIFIKKTKEVSAENIGLSIVLITAVLLPPLSWKAYYVASILGYATVIYYLLFNNIILYKKSIIFFIIFSFILHTFTADGIWGWKYAHIFQSYSCVTFSILSLYLALIFILINFVRRNNINEVRNPNG